jgi:hypothetical protein
MLERTMKLALFAVLFTLGCGDDDGDRDAGPPNDASRIDGGSSDAGSAAEDCDPKHVTCDEAEPACLLGTVAVVVDGCWGPCIDQSECAPIPCDREGPASECPRGWGCVGDGQCAPPRIMMGGGGM